MGNPPNMDEAVRLNMDNSAVTLELSGPDFRMATFKNPSENPSSFTPSQ